MAKRCGSQMAVLPTGTLFWPEPILIQSAQHPRPLLVLLLNVNGKVSHPVERKSIWVKNAQILEVSDSKTSAFQRKMLSVKKVLVFFTPWLPSTILDLQ